MPSILVSKKTDSGRTLGFQIRLSTIVFFGIVGYVIFKKVTAKKKKSETPDEIEAAPVVS